MDQTPPSCIALADNLDRLLSQLSASVSPSGWHDVQVTAGKLADILRIRDGSGGSTIHHLSRLSRLRSDKRTTIPRLDILLFLGRSPLSCRALSVVDRSQTTAMQAPSLSCSASQLIFAWTTVCLLNGVVPAQFERVTDDNRGHLLEAGLPQAIVSLLEGYSEHVVPPLRQPPLPLPILHLKVIRTAVGVLLNASINYGRSWRPGRNLEFVS